MNKLVSALFGLATALVVARGDACPQGMRYECVACHAAATKETVVSIVGLPFVAIADRSYDLEVRVTRPGFRYYGFWVRAKGTFAALEPKINALGGDAWHARPRDCGAPGCTAIFRVKWTAPSTGGPVSFVAWGNAADGSAMARWETNVDCISSGGEIGEQPGTSTTSVDVCAPASACVDAGTDADAEVDAASDAADAAEIDVASDADALDAASDALDALDGGGDGDAVDAGSDAGPRADESDGACSCTHAGAATQASPLATLAFALAWMRRRARQGLPRARSRC